MPEEVPGNNIEKPNATLYFGPMEESLSRGGELSHISIWSSWLSNCTSPLNLKVRVTPNVEEFYLNVWDTRWPALVWIRRLLWHTIRMLMQGLIPWINTFISLYALWDLPRWIFADLIDGSMLHSSKTGHPSWTLGIMSLKKDGLFVSLTCP